ncbi:MAG TPA: aminodeoxychorismate/anthranilate synthase component II [Verrucomicrobiota bacterium]|nr:aminodeoxychorismate/anthranilate synthase component II [Verrucomicrobiota bacterium]HNT14682.1 aminodeoxychorismate/anthranilate synthase component II [Verrucomicrobiota bacterium]
MLLIVDNYDSFTYNIVQSLGVLEVDLQIVRNDQITVAQVRQQPPERLLISPGPCTPQEAGISNALIRELGPVTPTLGVCLGHQCIGHVFGARVVVHSRMMHGKTSLIRHDGRDLFAGLPNPFPATRYHSLIIERASLPDCLEVTAETETGEIMGVRHKTFPIWGVQFHPESILTENGHLIFRNFLNLNPAAAPASGARPEQGTGEKRPRPRA